MGEERGLSYYASVMTSENPAPNAAPEPDRPRSIEDWVAAVGETAVFFTRLPWPAGGKPRFALAQRMPTLAVLGLAIGVAGGIDLAIARWLGAAPWLAAAIGLLTILAITGALHEDGLADTADALGPPMASRERRLAIMRDSRIGTFGALALVFSIVLRGGVLVQLTMVNAGLALLSLAAVHALSRAALAWPLHRLAAARPDGLAAATGRATSGDAGVTLCIGAGLAFLLLLGVAPSAALVVPVAAIAATLLVTAFVEARFGGNTGDTLGATQQVVEIVALIAIALCAGRG